MTGITELAREYAEKNVSLATSMYNPQAETIAAYSFTDGYKVALEKARALLEKWLQTEHHYNAINAACEELVLRTETEQFLAGDL